MNGLRLGLVRDFESGEFFEKFLVSAVFSILAIRVYLEVFGYPQLGEGRFHIAHILWGGFLMMFALVFLLSFLNREIKSLAAILGGLGFGMFVDELGKFVTSDNDYFFRPTIAIIYVIFVLLFLMFRAIEKYFKFSRREYAVNAFEMAKEAFAKDLDEEEKRHALAFLKRGNFEHPVLSSLSGMLESIRVEKQEKGFFERLLYSLRRNLRKILMIRFVPKAIVVIFVAVAITSLGRSILLFGNSRDFSGWGELLSSMLAGFFVVIGLVRFNKDRLFAYEMFKVSILVSILLTQFFEFLNEQLAAVFGLMLGIIVLGVIEFLIKQERLSSNS